MRYRTLGRRALGHATLWVGLASLLDLLSMFLVFGPMDLAAERTARFSLLLGVTTILAAVLFGALEQHLDHYRTVGLSRRQAALLVAAVAVAGLLAFGSSSPYGPAPLMALAIGTRMVMRAVLFANRHYRLETGCSLIDALAFFLLLLWVDDLVLAFVVSRLFGIGLRRLGLPSPVPFAHARWQSLASLELLALGPVIYLNLLYIVSARGADAQIATAFRLMQTLFAPALFAGSVIMRSLIISGARRPTDPPTPHPDAISPASDNRAIWIVCGLCGGYVIALWGVGLLGVSITVALLAAVYLMLANAKALCYARLSLSPRGPMLRACTGYGGLMVLSVSIMVATHQPAALSLTTMYLALVLSELAMLVTTLVLLGRHGNRVANALMP